MEPPSPRRCPDEATDPNTQSCRAKGFRARVDPAAPGRRAGRSTLPFPEPAHCRRALPVAAGDRLRAGRRTRGDGQVAVSPRRRPGVLPDLARDRAGHVLLAPHVRGSRPVAWRLLHRRAGTGAAGTGYGPRLSHLDWFFGVHKPVLHSCRDIQGRTTASLDCISVRVADDPARLAGHEPAAVRARLDFAGPGGLAPQDHASARDPAIRARLAN